MEIEQIVMDLIINSGETRSFAYEALEKAKEGKYKEADALIEKANDMIDKTHKIQTSLLQKEAAGGDVKVSLLFVHAQDHLMTSISEKNLISEIIELRKIINPLLNIKEN